MLNVMQLQGGKGQDTTKAWLSHGVPFLLQFAAECVHFAELWHWKRSNNIGPILAVCVCVGGGGVKGTGVEASARTHTHTQGLWARQAWLLRVCNKLRQFVLQDAGQLLTSPACLSLQGLAANCSLKPGLPWHPCRVINCPCLALTAHRDCCKHVLLFSVLPAGDCSTTLCMLA
jgi:hypothetical protein